MGISEWSRGSSCYLRFLFLQMFFCIRSDLMSTIQKEKVVRAGIEQSGKLPGRSRTPGCPRKVGSLVFTEGVHPRPLLGPSPSIPALNSVQFQRRRSCVGGWPGQLQAGTQEDSWIRGQLWGRLLSHLTPSRVPSLLWESCHLKCMSSC